MTARILRHPAALDVDAILGRGFCMISGPSFIVVGYDGQEFRCRTEDGARGSLTVAAFKEGLDAGAILPGFQVDTKRGVKVW